MLVSLMVPYTTVASENTFLYPNNSDKKLHSAVGFSKQIDPVLFKEVKDGSINLKEKILYKDLENTIKEKLSDFHDPNLVNIYLNRNENISPFRQIYLYCSVNDSKHKFKYRFIIFDAETKSVISKGDGTSNKR